MTSAIPPHHHVVLTSSQNSENERALSQKTEINDFKHPAPSSSDFFPKLREQLPGILKNQGHAALSVSAAFLASHPCMLQQARH
jgi:hypothetical protein